MILPSVSRFVTIALAGASTIVFPLRAQTMIPTRYVADRFFAAPVTEQGDTLQLIMDTGGGNVFVTKRALERMGVTPKFLQVAEGDSLWDGGAFPRFKAGASIPPALGSPKGRLLGFGDKCSDRSAATGWSVTTGLPDVCGYSTIRIIKSHISRRPATQPARTPHHSDDAEDAARARRSADSGDRRWRHDRHAP